ncbi:MAG: glycogen synthase GlgA [Planctomycetota bacterium]
MRILFVTSEAVPFAKTGGLADVSNALPRALQSLGHDVALALPNYRDARQNAPQPVEDPGVKLRVPVGQETVEGRLLRTTLTEPDVPVWLIDQPAYYDREALYGKPSEEYRDNAERFIFFSRAVLSAARELGWAPDVYHCNDWQAALVPIYLACGLRDDPFYSDSRSLLTIHNLAYQGTFPAKAFALTGLDESHFNWRELEFHGKLNLLKGGLVFADVLSTVSRRYAKEIQTEEFGCGLEGVLSARAGDLFGIVNGIDYSVWDPRTDPLIPATYSADDLTGKAVCKRALQRECGLPERDEPLVGMVSRLDKQKGLDILAEVFDEMMDLGIQFVLLGTGGAEYERRFAAFAKQYPDHFCAHISFDNALAHRIEAGSDMYLMPSRYEPCGLNQLYSLRYGAVPVVRKTGGLADTITNCTPTALAKETANGFSFQSYRPRALLAAMKRAVKLFAARRAWRRLMLTGMRQDWSWGRSARQYVEVYERAEARNE